MSFLLFQMVKHINRGAVWWVKAAPYCTLSLLSLPPPFLSLSTALSCKDKKATKIYYIQLITNQIPVWELWQTFTKSEKMQILQNEMRGWHDAVEMRVQWLILLLMGLRSPHNMITNNQLRLWYQSFFFSPCPSPSHSILLFLCIFFSLCVTVFFLSAPSFNNTSGHWLWLHSHGHVK